jgi:hypothetical protein
MRSRSTYIDYSCFAQASLVKAIDKVLEPLTFILTRAAHVNRKKLLYSRIGFHVVP